MSNPIRILALAVIAATCFLAYIGYFGGPVFTDKRRAGQGGLIFRR